MYLICMMGSVGFHSKLVWSGSVRLDWCEHYPHSSAPWFAQKGWSQSDSVRTLVRFTADENAVRTKYQKITRGVQYWLFDCKHLMTCKQYHNLISVEHYVGSSEFMGVNCGETGLYQDRQCETTWTKLRKYNLTNNRTLIRTIAQNYAWECPKICQRTIMFKGIVNLKLYLVYCSLVQSKKTNM